jgi:hypothetical protein
LKNKYEYILSSNLVDDVLGFFLLELYFTRKIPFFHDSVVLLEGVEKPWNPPDRVGIESAKDQNLTEAVNVVQLGHARIDSDSFVRNPTKGGRIRRL